MRRKSRMLLVLGDSIREYRTRNGCSQEMLGEMVGLHRTYIGMVERGEKNITMQNFYKIATVLKINVSEVFAVAQEFEAMNDLADSGVGK